METHYCFDYHSHNYQMLKDDIYNYSNIDIPFCIFDDIIREFLVENQSCAWYLSPKESKDQQGMVFLFKPLIFRNNPRIIMFEYLGCRRQRP